MEGGAIFHDQPFILVTPASSRGGELEMGWGGIARSASRVDNLTFGSVLGPRIKSINIFPVPFISHAQKTPKSPDLSSGKSRSKGRAIL